MPWVDAETLGPGGLAAYAWPYLIIAVPNLLLSSALLFALATTTRSMLASYIGVLVFVMGYLIVTGVLGGRPEYQDLLAPVRTDGGGRGERSHAILDGRRDEQPPAPVDGQSAVQPYLRAGVERRVPGDHLVALQHDRARALQAPPAPDRAQGPQARQGRGRHPRNRRTHGHHEQGRRDHRRAILASTEDRNPAGAEEPRADRALADRADLHRLGALFLANHLRYAVLSAHRRRDHHGDGRHVRLYPDRRGVLRRRTGLARARHPYQRDRRQHSDAGLGDLRSENPRDPRRAADDDDHGYADRHRLSTDPRRRTDRLGRLSGMVCVARKASTCC